MIQKILVLAANPKTTLPLRLDEEIREIDQSLRLSRNRDQFSLEKYLAVQTKDLRRALLDVKPRFLHFSGHGAGEKGILLEDETGDPQLVKAEPLANLFKHSTNYVECVVWKNAAELNPQPNNSVGADDLKIWVVMQM